MNLRELLSLTILLLLYFLCDRIFRGKVSAEARYMAGIVLMAVLLIPFRFTFITVDISDWLNTKSIESTVISVDDDMKPLHFLTGDFSDAIALGQKAESDFHWYFLLIVLYVLGIAVSLGIAFRKHILLCKTAERCSKMPSEEMRWQLEMLCGKMGLRKPRLLVCRSVAAMTLGAPFTFGIFRRTIVMPEHIGGEEAEILLAHELHHLKHHDTLIRLLMTLLKAFYWYYPPVYLLMKKMESVCEEACDERMTDGKNTAYRAAYGKLLVRFASESRTLSVSFSNAKTRLKARIEALFSDCLRREGYWLILLTVCMAVAFTSVGFYRKPNYNEQMSGEEYLSELEVQASESLEADLLRAFDTAGRIDDLAYGLYYIDPYYVYAEALFYRNALVSLLIVQSADGTECEMQTISADAQRAENCIGIRIVYDGEENGRKQYKSIEILTEKELLCAYAMTVLSPNEQNFASVPDYPMTEEWENALLDAVKAKAPDEVNFYEILIERVKS
ncbi:MAG: M56 family metallopeptidase [Clostridia bacterium]|nr:M56 family metallopeptidase [Clostridia bacterium]